MKKIGRPGLGLKCPVCMKPGSPQLKTVKNRKGGNEYRYVYYAHATGPHTVKWCYVGGKTLPRRQSRKAKRKKDAMKVNLRRRN